MAQYKSQLLPASGPLLVAVTQLGWLQQLQDPAPFVAKLHEVLADQSCAVTPLAAAAAPAHIPWTASETPTDSTCHDDDDDHDDSQAGQLMHAQLTDIR